MIRLTRLDGHDFLLNSDYIESVFESPDTIITTRSGNNIIVRESMQEILRMIETYNRKIRQPNKWSNL